MTSECGNIPCAMHTATLSSFYLNEIEIQAL